MGDIADEMIFAEQNGLMLEYPGQGSGHAGNDTSRERQEREDAEGITALAQQMALSLLRGFTNHGMTAAEYEDMAEIGHGRASSALSHLHRAGHIRRIKERRQRHEVYVLPEYVEGREESPYRPRVTKARHPREYTEQEWEAALVDAGAAGTVFSVPLAMKIAKHLP